MLSAVGVLEPDRLRNRIGDTAKPNCQSLPPSLRITRPLSRSARPGRRSPLTPRLVPLTTISICPLPRREQTNRSRQSSTGVSRRTSAQCARLPRESPPPGEKETPEHDYSHRDNLIVLSLPPVSANPHASFRAASAGLGKGSYDETACRARRSIPSSISRSRAGSRFHARRPGHHTRGRHGQAKRGSRPGQRNPRAPQAGSETGGDDHSAEGQDPRQRQARNAIWPRSRFGGATESPSAAKSGLPKTQPASVNCRAWNCN